MANITSTEIQELLNSEIGSSDFIKNQGVSGWTLDVFEYTDIDDSFEIYVSGDSKDGYCISSEEHSEDDVSRVLGVSFPIKTKKAALKLGSEFATYFLQTYCENL